MPVNFVEAVHQKYASEVERPVDEAARAEIMMPGNKLAQEIGFEKIRVQLAQLHELKIVLVDGMCIHCAESDGQKIRDTCPKIVDLDLSRNLFESGAQIVEICRQLERLKSLRLE